MRITLFCLFLFPFMLSGQHQLVPRNSDVNLLINRFNIIDSSSIHSSIQYMSSSASWHFILSQRDEMEGKNLWIADKLLLKYPEFWQNNKKNSIDEIEYIDSSEVFYTYKEKVAVNSSEIFEDRKPLLKFFYKNPSYLYSIETENLLLNINPVINFGIGRDNAQKNYIFQNTRGVELNGHIDKKVFFYSNILENQASFPKYINDYITKFKAVPGQGLYKNYNSVIFGDGFGYDYLNAQAYIATALTKSIGIEFGHGRNFIGNGYRSLMLSDFSNNNLYLKFNTKVWKIHYQNLFSQLIPVALRNVPGDLLIPRKYSAAHYLSFKHNNFEIGLFETTIFERQDGFELQYLNPIILYRLVEHSIRSSDNVIVGVNTNLNLLNTIQLYGQIILDEFKLDQLLLKENRGWWGNKYGFQLGLNYLNAFAIKNLDYNFEFNLVRPYTYGHRGNAHYSHYDMALAHPLGANFREIVSNIQYYFSPKFSISSKNIFYSQGLDQDEMHFGSNITISNTERIQDYNNSLLQGNRTNVFLTNNRISYEVFHNYFIDLNFIYRQQSFDDNSEKFNDFIISAGLRVNYWEPEINF